MKHRIEYLISELKMTNAKFAEEIGVQKSIISHILTGRNKPSLDFITRILKRFDNINSDWLLFGKGNIFSSENSSSTNNENEKTSLFDFINDEKPTEYTTDHSENKQNITEKQINKPVTTKQIVKIIVYYSDNTFEVFNSKHK